MGYEKRAVRKVRGIVNFKAAAQLHTGLTMGDRLRVFLERKGNHVSKNFETIPWLHNRYGFFGAVTVMLAIPVWMLLVFRRRGWF